MYHLLIDNQTSDPFTVEQVRAMLITRQVTPQTLFWREGLDTWKALESAAEFTGEFPPPGRIISGFWRRIRAYLLDALVLGVPALAVGFLFFDFLVRLGPWALLIGFAFASAYFSFFNSSLGGGQTVGKRLLGIEVVDVHGHHISPARSLLRYVILALPYYLNCLIKMVPLASNSSISAVLSLLIFVGGGAIFYLYVFNRRTPQSLHDIAVGTFVVRRHPPGEVHALPLWRGHWIAAGVAALLVIIAAVKGPSLLRTPFFAGLLGLQQAILATGDVRTVSIFRGTNWVTSSSGTQETTSYTVSAVWKKTPANLIAAQNKVVALVLAHDRAAMQVDYLTISISYGYDLGIASWHYSGWRKNTPRAWRQALAGAPPT